MTIRYCPRCNRRYVYQEHSGDFVHDCNSQKDVLDKEDVLVIGEYTDADGVKHEVNNANLAGLQDKNFGTRTSIEGMEAHVRTKRGKKADTHRTRDHEEYIELTKKKC